MLDIIFDFLGWQATNAAIDSATAKNLKSWQKLLAFIIILIGLVIIAVTAILLFIWLE